jgi:hypothetical protein
MNTTYRSNTGPYNIICFSPLNNSSTLMTNELALYQVFDTISTNKKPPKKEKREG